MHLRAIGRQFTQMNAYFLVMNSKRCKHPYMRHCCFKLPFGKLKGHETGGPRTIRGPGNELEECVLRETDPYDHTKNFVCITVNYQRTSLQSIKKSLQGSFFIMYEKVDF